jgi:tRNA pseudouridine38-40 synthase
VEGEILRAVVRRGVAPSAVSARIQVASRTDRGVSAVGNALVLTSVLPPTALLRVLNGIEPDIVFTAATAVPESFRVRAAIRRVYRYFQPADGHDFQKWQEVAPRFSGQVDVRSFGRAVPAGAPVWRTVESVTVTPHPGGAMVEVRAPSFVWGMVRKVVATLREVDAGRISIDRLEAALHGRTRLTLPMAEPEPLVLWDVEYPLTWEHTWAGPNRHQLAWEKAARDNLWARREFLDAFSTLPSPRRG